MHPGRYSRFPTTCIPLFAATVVVRHSRAKWPFSWHMWHSMSAFRCCVDSRRTAHCFLCSRSSLISPRSASRRSPMAFRCVVTSDSSVLLAPTTLRVYRSWISTISTAIFKGHLQSLAASLNTFQLQFFTDRRLKHVERCLFLACIDIGVIGPTGQSSCAVGNFLGRPACVSFLSIGPRPWLGTSCSLAPAARQNTFLLRQSGKGRGARLSPRRSTAPIWRTLRID